jgi:hypothetical protein
MEYACVARLHHAMEILLLLRVMLPKINAFVERLAYQTLDVL